MSKKAKSKYETGHTITFNNPNDAVNDSANLPNGMKENTDGTFQQTTTFGRDTKDVAGTGKWRGTFEQIKQAWVEQKKYSQRNAVGGLPAVFGGLFLMVIGAVFFSIGVWASAYLILPFLIIGPIIFGVGVYCVVYGFVKWGAWKEKRARAREPENRQAAKLADLNKMPENRGAVVAMILMGVLFALVGAGLTSWRIIDDARMANWPTVQGTVIGFETRSSDDGNTYAPVVEYYVEGRRYRFTSSTSSYPPEYKIGDMVAVKYNPKKPSDADIDGSMWLMYVLGLVFFFAGTGLAIGGIVNGVKRKKRLNFQNRQTNRNV